MTSPTPSPISDQAAGEPNWSHPKLQALLSRNARMSLQLGIIEDLIDDPEHEYDSGMEADYTTDLTDKVHAFVKASRSTAPTTGSAPVAVKAFGTGAQVVIECTFDGEHAVVIVPAKQPGEVGASAKREGPITDDSLVDAVVLTFPTAEQVECVANALVAAPPANGMLTAIRNALNVAYADGWAVSGEGYNYEHTGKHFDRVNWEANRNLAIDHLVNRIAASMGGDQT